MILTLFFGLSFQLSTDYGIEVETVSNWDRPLLFEQIFYFILDYSKEVSHQYLFSVLENIESEDILMEQAEKLLPHHMFSLLKSELEIGSLLPKIQYTKSIKDKESMRIYKTDFVIGSPTTVTFLNLHENSNAKIVLDMIKNQKDLLLRLDIPVLPGEYKLRGYGISIRPTSMETDDQIGQEKRTNLDQNIPIDNTTKYIENYIFNEDQHETSQENMYLMVYEYIKNHKDVPLLRILRDITNNWPAFKEDVFSTKVSPETIESFQNINKIISKYSDYHSINGRIFESPNFDIFTVFDIIKRERTFIDILNNTFGIKIEEINRLSRADISSMDILFDYRFQYIDFYTDGKCSEGISFSEEDQRKLGFDISKTKKVVDFISYLDLSSKEGRESLKTSLQLSVIKELPIRIGFVPYFNTENKNFRKISFAYHHLAIKNPKLAVEFIYQIVLRENDNEIDILAEKIYNTLTWQRSDFLSWSELHQLYSPDTAVFQRLNSVNRYYRDKGILLNTICVNGKIERIENSYAKYLMIILEIMKIYNEINVEENNLDPIEVMNITNFVVNSLRSPLSPTIEKHGTKIYMKSLSEQKEFIHKFQNIKWDHVDSEITKNYYILLTNETDNKVFRDFMQKQHRYPTAFAINPDTDLFKFKKYPVLICGGLVFEKFEVTEENLFEIDNFFSVSISQSLNTILDSNNSLLYYYLITMYTDWYSSGIERGSVNPELFQVDQDIVHLDNDGDFEWEIVSNPLSESFQESIDIIKYVSENKLAKVKLLAAPANDIIPRVTCFNFFYRSSLNSDVVLFTHLNEMTRYNMILSNPSSWITSQFHADIDPNNIYLEDKEPGLYKVKYVLDKICVEGKLRNLYYNSRKSFLKFDSQSIAQLNRLMYWQAPTLPGRHYISDVLEYDVDSFATNLIPFDKNIFINAEFNVSEEYINIFTIPTDKAHEKCAKVMMMSVMKHTKSKVKFFIFKKYLSFDFIQSMPEFSRKHGFKYEYVDMNWPNVMFSQYDLKNSSLEYRLLFLDMLLPFNIPRVIFIDCQTVVRGDISNLYNSHMNGLINFVGDSNSQKISSNVFVADLTKFKLTNIGDQMRYLSYIWQYNLNTPNDASYLTQLTKIYPSDLFGKELFWCRDWYPISDMENALLIWYGPSSSDASSSFEFAYNNIPEWKDYINVLQNNIE
ncbi:hypothetical protein TVAG_405130 [Trichomonas vaginalis G3]|uniref:Glucosyltransferase 24 catalytic domain-containing protein n=1 Tax=Trichomonas vaginalis (strain ATCC PRA-98 / G3) TaxID=412133 RepID=A2E331_TRIV3|nr:UDP-glucose:glycoprotein glucosyltransferase family [Trichomonas vaginalis G3]EAY12967.1 hypothetical protein TVAG_405130 [Trichomonas vaginalis G3]KAI5499790.1 UDP-glucose:glycoprotein glucosyltransferase family [Trichomonas vaginalis G3]|eukprot:XP_001325190.1 hypothetical protein [Trichomonas vaginalis G3]